MYTKLHVLIVNNVLLFQCFLFFAAPSQDGQSEMGDKLSVTKATDNLSRRSSAR